MKDFFYRRHEHHGNIQLHHNRQPNACLARIDIGLVADALDCKEQAPLSWLSDEEKEYMQRFRFPKRRHEWISGRIVAKHCLLQIKKGKGSAHQADAFSILPDDHGQPVLSFAATGCTQKISISHSHQYAVAMAAEHACGIDIQHIGPQILKVQDRIATAAEISIVRQLLAGNLQTGLTLLWAVKEALKKHKLPDLSGIFEAISIEQIYPDDRKYSWYVDCRLTSTNQMQTVRAVLLNQYMLAWCHG